MSSVLDAQTGDPYYTNSVGPQTDGTYTQPAIVQTPQPADAGGGAPGIYPAQVLDVFKYGLGVWNSQVQQTNMLDYKRWEATNFGIFQQGRPAATLTASASAGGNTLMMLMIMGAVVLLATRGG